MGALMSIQTYRNITPDIHATAFIDDSACIIGQVRIGPDCSVWPMVVIRGDVNSIDIGEGTSIQDGTVIHATHDGPYTPGGQATAIGNRVTVGHKVLLHACSICDECIIGMGSIVLDEAVIEPKVLLGAGSLVPPGKVLESGYLYLGSPAKQVRALTADELENLAYSAQHYVRLKNSYAE